MTLLNFLTYNVHGLNTPRKRYNILREINQFTAEVVFLQETHFSHETNLKLNSKDFPKWLYGDFTTKRAKEVAIGFAIGVRFTLEERLVDPEGRYLFLKGRLCDVDCTLASIYCPNKNPIKYLR